MAHAIVQSERSKLRRRYHHHWIWRHKHYRGHTATIIADNQRVSNGRVIISNEISVGTVLVRVIGNQRSVEAIIYTTNGIIATRSRRVITIINCRYNSLTQMFMLSEGDHLAWLIIVLKIKVRSEFYFKFEKPSLDSQSKCNRTMARISSEY